MAETQLRLAHFAVPVQGAAPICLLLVAGAPGERLAAQWIGAGRTRRAAP
jgi:hypothetical protein